MVEKTREKGRVVAIATRVVFGTMAAVIAALGMSRVSRAINTSFVERQNGTDRHRNARKARKTYRFSKDWRHHEAVTYLTMYVYNFCWPVRTLRIKDEQGRWQEAEPGDGGRAGRSCLVDPRMAGVPVRATLIGHEEEYRYVARSHIKRRRAIRRVRGRPCPRSRFASSQSGKRPVTGSKSSRPRVR